MIASGSTGNWAAFGVVGTLIVSFVGASFGLYQARRADRSATFTKTIEVSVTSLVDQLQEEVQIAKRGALDCEGRCVRLQREVDDLKRQREEQDVRISNMEAEIIRLKRKAGEL